MSKPSKKRNYFNYYIIGLVLGFIIWFGSIGIAYYLEFIFTRLSTSEFLIILLACTTFGLFIGEFLNHSKTLKELKDLKKSNDKQEQSTD